MIETTEVASIRVPRGTVAKMKTLAHKKSLENGRDISWCAMVREILEAYLAGASRPKPQKSR